MKTIRFHTDVSIDFLQGKGMETFRAGREYDMADDQANRWVRRSKAELVEPSVAAVAADEMAAMQALADKAKADSAAKAETAKAATKPGSK